MKRLFPLLLTILLVLSANAATTYYVDTAGNDSNAGTSSGAAWQTIGKATAQMQSGAVAAGSTVSLKAGSVFTGILQVSRNNVTVNTYGVGGLPLLTNLDLTNATGILIDSLSVSGSANTNRFTGAIHSAGGSNLTIQNCTVISNATEGIYFKDCDFVTVSNCVICGNGYEDPTGIAYCGILGRVTSGTYHHDYTVIGCTITNTRGHGIDIGGNLANFIAYGAINVISNDLSWNQSGFYPTFVTNYYVGWNRFYYESYAPFNYVADNGGLSVEGCSDGIVEYNDFGFCRGAGMNFFGSATTEDCSRNIVRYNVVHHSNDPNDVNSGFGIVINPWLAPYCNSNQFYYNVVYSNSGTGFLADNGAGLSNLVMNNTFAWNRNGVDTHGIGVPGLFMTNNLFLDNTNLQISAGSTTGGLVTDHNLYYSSDGNSLVQFASTTYSMTTLHNFEASCLTNNPLIVGSGNFQLTALSPAINAGVNVGLTKDYLGYAISGLPDIGAYEYELIPADRRVPWIPGVTVGVQGGIPVRTNLIDASQSPYNADKTGATDAKPAIQSAINAATTNQVVYLPTGTYKLSSMLTLGKSGVSIRGDGPTNTILFTLASVPGGVQVGAGNPGSDTFPVSQASRGSTSILLSATNSTTFGDTITVGSVYSLSQVNSGTTNWNVISASGYERIQQQDVLVMAISGSNVTVSAPLIWDFTNVPILTEAIYSGGLPVAYSGLENLGITLTNNGVRGPRGTMLNISGTANCWCTNVSVYFGDGYIVQVDHTAHLSFLGNNILKRLSAGVDNTGIEFSDGSHCLFENNVFDDLAPPIYLWGPVSYNAFFGNFTTNNLSMAVDNHNTHPMMNLFEENIFDQYFEVDGYFGGASHFTLLRNVLGDSNAPIMFKRWSTYMNVVGNVLGRTNGAYVTYSTEVSGIPPTMIWQLGYPDIGDQSHNGDTTPPVPYNYPGDVMAIYGYSNGIFTFTNTQVNTTNLIGYFTNIPAPYGAYALVFQDTLAADTNTYYNPALSRGPGWTVRNTDAGTSSNLAVSVWPPNGPLGITVSNGWKVWYVDANDCWHQLFRGNKATHIIAGNYDYYTNLVVWTNDWTGTNIAQTIATSLLYTNGAPAYWGTNRWPAIDTLGTPMVAPIPSQLRYAGISSGPVTDVWVSPQTNALGSNMRTGSGLSTNDPYIGDFDYIIDCLSNITVHLMPGTHYSQGNQQGFGGGRDLEINANTTLAGYGTNLTIVKKFNGLRALGGNVLLHSLNSGVTVSNLMVDCNGAANIAAGLVQDGVGLAADNCVVDNVWVKNFGGSLGTLAEGYCIANGWSDEGFAGSTNCLTQNCTATDEAGDYETGIWLAGSIIVRSNTVVYAGDPTRLTACYNDWGNRNSLLYHNYGYGATEGVWSDTGTETNLTIMGNTLKHCYWGIRYGKSGGRGGDVDGLTVVSNSITLVATNGFAAGMQLNAIPGLTFHNLTVSSNTVLGETGTLQTGSYGVIVQSASICSTNTLNLVIASNTMDTRLTFPIGFVGQGVVVTGNVTTNGTPITSTVVLPWFCAHPQSQSVSAGSLVTFTATSVEDWAPLSYQWSFNGNNIAGATQTSYTLASAQVGDSGSYSCMATNNGSGNAAQSTVASLVVSAFVTNAVASTPLPFWQPF